VVEAAFEDMELKKKIFAALDVTMKPGAVLATNTSTLDIDQIAAATERPEAVVGTHFFSPANVMKLQENVRGAKTSSDVIATVTALAKKIGKVPVLAGNRDGFIGNRILAVYGRECDFLLEEGATPWQIDRALQGFGFPMGLYLMRDMSGLDVGWRIRQYREQFRDKALRYSPIADRLCEQGRFGQKTGKGYYLYDGQGAAAKATPDPEVEALIEQVAKELGIPRRTVTNEQIVNRVLTAMVNEGARILDEGVAQRASDIDVTYIHGYGFPRYEGGPMFWAERMGLAWVLQEVRNQHAAQGKLWEPAPALEAAAARGRWVE
jgi:3-hydroxyacyl-CoA dehydrogenase